MMLVAITGIAVPLHAAPPNISEAELNALRAQSREHMSRLNELEQLRDEKIQARRRSERSHRQQQLQSAIRDIVVQDEAEHSTMQAELDDFKLDFTAVDMSDVSLGMLPSQDQPAEGTVASGSSQVDLAEQATNPAAPLVQLQFQNVFIPESYAADGYANQFIVQPVIPIAKQSWFPRSLWRLTIPLLTQPDLDVGIDGTGGLGDITLLGGPVFDYDWGMLVVGGVLTMPTATDSRLGARQWQLGPVIGPIFTKVIPKTQFGAIIFQQWGLGGAGDQYTDILSIQPVLTYHFDKGWYTGVGDYIWTFNWETNENYIPLSFKVGRVFTMGDQPVNIFISPYYNVGDEVAGQGQWGIKLSFTLLFGGK